MKFGIFGICRALSFIYIFHFIIFISIRSLDAIGFVFCRHTNLSYQHQNDEISLSVEISPVMILFTKHVCVCARVSASMQSFFMEECRTKETKENWLDTFISGAAIHLVFVPLLILVDVGENFEANSLFNMLK